jgi:hypothetical protein
MPNHEQAELIFIDPYKMLVETYLRKYNKFEAWYLSISLGNYIYANKKMILGLL